MKTLGHILKKVVQLFCALANGEPESNNLHAQVDQLQNIKPNEKNESTPALITDGPPV
jgi:hypothetical protein